MRPITLEEITAEISSLEEVVHRLKTRIDEYEAIGRAEFISAAQLYRKDLRRQELYLITMKSHLRVFHYTKEALRLSAVVASLKSINTGELSIEDSLRIAKTTEVLEKVVGELL